MKNILIINGAAEFGLISKAQLNTTLTDFAQNFLEKNGDNVRVTHVEHGYDIEEEVEKYLWADVIIYQMPGWWMGLPWIFKKYIDEVFSAGHGKLYESDGRTRKDLSKQYGSAGLSQNKKYMLSLTWNAPIQALVVSKCDVLTTYLSCLDCILIKIDARQLHDFLSSSKSLKFSV